MKRSLKPLVVGMLLPAAALIGALLGPCRASIPACHPGNEESLPYKISPPTPADLPADCAIIASEAASRLSASGAWVRIIFITFIDPRDGKVYGHALCVWQPPTTNSICIYDRNGTLDLDVASHEVWPVAIAYARAIHVTLLQAHFLR